MFEVGFGCCDVNYVLFMLIDFLIWVVEVYGECFVIVYGDVWCMWGEICMCVK